MTADGQDTDDAATRTELRRRALAVGLVVLVLGLAATIVLAAVTTYPAKNGARYQAPSGLVVYPQTQIDVRSGNPFGQNTIALNGTSNPVFAGRTAEARIDTFAGTWTNLSQINAQNGIIYINRSGSDPVGVTGTVDALSQRDIVYGKSNDKADIQATAGGDWTLLVKNTGLTQGTGLVVRETDSRNVLDAAAVQANGSVRFSELTSVSSEDLNIEQGPSVLKIFNASDPTQLANTVTLQVRSFNQNGGIIERTVSDGTMDLTGIPKNQPITITVKEESSSTYVYRRTVIESVSEQQEVYLLSSSNTNVANVVFELDDRTGRFASESTVLFVQKPVRKDFDSDGDSETRYQNVVGDTFGTGSFPTILETNQRYRLVVENARGERRVIGSYVAQIDDRAVVQIGNVEININKGQSYATAFRAFQQDTDNDPANENFTRFVYVDTENRTERIEWNLTLVETGNVINSGTVTGSFGRYVVTVPVGNSTKNHTWELNWEVVRQQDDGSDRTITGSLRAGDVGDLSFPVDQRWLSLLGYVAVVAVGGLVVQVDSALGGLAATGAGSVLTALGIVSIPIPALGLAGAVSVIALLGRTTR